LGNPDDLFNLSYSVRIIKENSNWYGLVTNNSNSQLIRLTFGIDITSAPTAEVVTLDSNPMNKPRGLDIAFDDGNYFAIVGNNNTANLTLVNFGSSISNDGMVSSIATNNSHLGVSFTKQDDNWFAFTMTNTLERVAFGNALSNTPTVDVVSLDNNITNGSNIIIEQDSAHFYGIAASRSGNIYRINFEDDLAAPIVAVDNLGRFGDFSDVIAFDGVKQNSSFFFQGISVGSDQLSQLEFHNECGYDVEYSSETVPSNVKFDDPEQYTIFLDAFNDNSTITNRSVQSITVNDNAAPNISFTTDNNCIANTNNFTAIDDGNIASYSWDFNNDGIEDSNSSNPTYDLGSVGDHIIKLTVNDGTCSNFVQDTFSIYPVPPSPSFDLSSAPNCSFSSIGFTNSTDLSAFEGADVTFDWNFNGEGHSNQIDTTFTFLSDGNKDITLTMSIPGCSTPYTETVTVIPGPDNDFVIDNECIGETAAFNNSTTGENLINPFWDFGDGYTGTTLSPEHFYEAPGDYEVILGMENTDGCVNTITRTIRINGLPEVSFESELACEGQSIGFSDTSVPGDQLNNIDSWTWDFDGFGDATIENPDFAFDESGDYEVNLTVINTGGCENTATQTVTVNASPIANFDIELGCLETETIFADITETTTENPISSWFWQIDGEVFTTQNPEKTFSEAGMYTANMIVTAENLCAAVLEQTFEIFDLPDLAFEVEYTCDNEFTEFTDISVSTAGNIVSRSWDFGNLGVRNGQQTGLNFKESGEYEIGLTVIDELGCETDSITTLTIHPAPSALFSPSTDLGLPPLAINFFNQSSGATNYLWSFMDEENTTSNDESPSFAYQTMGTYYPELIASTDEGCSDTTTFEIAVAEPVLDLDLIEISTIESNGKIDINLNIRNNGSLQIDGFDIRIDIDNQSSIFESYDELLGRQQSVNVPLNFSLAAEDSNIEFVCITLIYDIEGYEDVNLFNNEGCVHFEQEIEIETPYPNPINDDTPNITVQAVLPAKSPVQIALMNSSGQIVYEQTYTEVDAGLNTFLIDIQSFRKGMYFLRVVYGSTESTQKILKI
ncbi:MAG: PKD domain-containing protein, partial [Reichenbachiella sp.]